MVCPKYHTVYRLDGAIKRLPRTPREPAVRMEKIVGKYAGVEQIYKRRWTILGAKQKNF